jgi:hypothetical protein
MECGSLEFGCPCLGFGELVGLAVPLCFSDIADK